MVQLELLCLLSCMSTRQFGDVVIKIYTTWANRLKAHHTRIMLSLTMGLHILPVALTLQDIVL